MFTRCVDDAAAYGNASTRFTDDGEFGLGYEVEISTYKYMIHGMHIMDGMELKWSGIKEVQIVMI